MPLKLKTPFPAFVACPRTQPWVVATTASSGRRPSSSYIAVTIERDRGAFFGRSFYEARWTTAGRSLDEAALGGPAGQLVAAGELKLAEHGRDMCLHRL